MSNQSNPSLQFLSLNFVLLCSMCYSQIWYLIWLSFSKKVQSQVQKCKKIVEIGQKVVIFLQKKSLKVGKNRKKCTPDTRPTHHTFLGFSPDRPPLEHRGKFTSYSLYLKHSVKSKTKNHFGCQNLSNPTEQPVKILRFDFLYLGLAGFFELLYSRSSKLIETYADSNDIRVVF